MLVILGLLAGGVLAGRDLIQSAEIRGAIGQIDQYKTSVHTFQTKFNGIPGDIVNATDFGLEPRGLTPGGPGFGTGVLEELYESAGKNVLFWKDLNMSGLIDGSFTAADDDISHYANTIPSTDLDKYFPKAKLGHGNYVIVHFDQKFNVFVIQTVLDTNGGLGFNASADIPVHQAYSVDQKVDDGLPLEGGVTAIYVVGQAWAGAKGGTGGFEAFDPAVAVAFSTQSCYDDGGVVGAQRHYSLANADMPNCALTFKFQ